MYAAQVNPPIDAEIAEKGHLWAETSYLWPLRGNTILLIREASREKVGAVSK